MKTSSKKGFTLIELLITIVIIGILASIAVPLMRVNVKKAMTMEAINTMGAIRTAERYYYSMYGNTFATFTKGSTTIPQNNLEGQLYITDLEGRYYKSGDYSVSGNVIAADPANTSLNKCSMNLISGAVSEDTLTPP